MDELHALRDAYGADVVSLIEDDPQYCGIAYRMATLATSFESSAFNVVHHISNTRLNRERLWYHFIDHCRCIPLIFHRP